MTNYIVPKYIINCDCGAVVHVKPFGINMVAPQHKTPSGIPCGLVGPVVVSRLIKIS